MTTIRSLAELADVFNGKTPSKDEQRAEGHPVLKIKDVSWTGDFKGKFESFVEPSLATKHQSRWISSGDSLILNAAHNADYVASKMFFAGASVEGALPTGEWLIVRAKSDLVLPAYLNFWLRSASARKAIKFLVKGIHLYPKDVAALSVPIRSLPEQRRIVDLLSRADGIVRLRREAEKKAAELIPALFLDMFGDPATNPKGWPVARLDAVAQIISGATKGRRFDPSEAIELPYMRVANVKDGHLDLTEIKTIAVKRGEVDKYRLLPGDLLMTEGGDPDKLGRGALWSGEIETCLHQNHIFKVRADRSSLLPEYLCELVGSRYGKAYFFRVAKKTTGIATINRTQLGGFPVVVPPLDRQQEFGEKLGAVRSIQSQQSTATAKAQATFDALLARVFNQ
jgi:type I restriction enzyme S subunit